jgi:hypothetical protein
MSEHHHNGPWSVWITEDRDHNGRPYKMTVCLADERHITEADAEWLRQVIRDAREPYDNGGVIPPAATYVRNDTGADIPVQPSPGASQFWADHANDMGDPEYRAAYIAQAARIAEADSARAELAKEVDP